MEAGAGRRDGFQPVSYTHLDVYKRQALEEASKALSDFIKRNNMFDIDMEATKFAAICGYAGRLFYIDPKGNERVMITPPYETIILSETEMTEPEFGLRYYQYLDLNDQQTWKAEFYDESTVYYYEGQLDAFELVDSKPHLFDYCPLQGIPNNRELIGDAEKQLALIDDHDSNIIAVVAVIAIKRQLQHRAGRGGIPSTGLRSFLFQAIR